MLRLAHTCTRTVPYSLRLEVSTLCKSVRGNDIVYHRRTGGNMPIISMVENLPCRQLRTGNLHLYTADSPRTTGLPVNKGLHEPEFITEFH